MKCLILAGGKGNSLWPLSREEYPKQFMQIKKNRSLLQETVARNIPFCDEFLIATNASYHFIVEGQMKAFQGLKYRCILEEEGRKTAPAIALACMYLNPSELVYVVSADQIIEGPEYKETVMRGQALARQGRLVTFGMKALSAHTGYGYIRSEKEQVLEFCEKPDADTAKRYLASGDYLWNSGNFLFCAGDFLHELERYAPEIYKACRAIRGRTKFSGRALRIPRREMAEIPAVSVEQAVFERSGHVSVVRAAFHWYDIGDLEILSAYMKDDEGANVIRSNCENLTVINQTDHQLVVVNGLRDVAIVNTDDALYVTARESGPAIKQIMQGHPEYGAYFEKSRVVYRPWGWYEILNYTANYKVKKVLVYPGRALTRHTHAMRSEQWSVVQGTATVTLGDETRELPVYHSIEVPLGVSHMLANRTEEDLIIMEVSFGPQVTENDKENVTETQTEAGVAEALIRCEPAFKDYLWGGTKLRDIYGKNCDYDVIAESWELSAHEDGQCRVASGHYRGMLFGEYLREIGEEALGWKCQAFEKFPLLIKFIDARSPLSVQVHPDDAYALSNENEYGKSELWYVVDCEPGACLYYGLNRAVSAQELKTRAQNDTLTEILNRVEVHRGDTFFVEAGTIHAIGGGILLCEIQQNSNCTYRLYDYGRLDKYGSPRPLHLDKAAAVADVQGGGDEMLSYPLEEQEGYRTRKLCACKYFTSVRYEVDESVCIPVDETSFSALVFLEGQGKIRVSDESLEFRPADCFFVHAGKRNIEIQGKGSFILTRL